MRALVIAAAFLSACTAAAPSPRVPSFRYELEPLADVLIAGEPLRYEWVPHPDPNISARTVEVTLCYALFGPWPDVETLRREYKASDPPACPPPGAVVTSDTVRTSTVASARVKADAPGPSRPGFYNLVQFKILTHAVQPDGSIRGGSESSGRVVEVRAR